MGVPTRPRILPVIALLVGLVPARTALADEPSRLMNPLGLRAREEVFVAPPPPRAAPQAPAPHPAVVVAPRGPGPRAAVPSVPAQHESTPRAATPSVPAQRESPARESTPRENARRETPRQNDAARSAARSETARTRTPSRRPRRPAPPCLSPPTELVRVDGPRRETKPVSLTFCDGRPRPEALEALSVLARPHRLDAPEASAIRAYARRAARRPRRGETRPDPNFVAEGVRRLDAGLVPRVARIAAQFPGKTIEIVSGWRPNERSSSRHHQARALDLRVRGVSRETLRDFARTLDETGVGYYPNSVFVHVDVRDTRSYWVDRSGPGEEADYGTWPPTYEERRRVEERVVASALATLERLREDTPSAASDPSRAEGSSPQAPELPPDDAPDGDSEHGPAAEPATDGTTAERAPGDPSSGGSA